VRICETEVNASGPDQSCKFLVKLGLLKGSILDCRIAARQPRFLLRMR